MNAKKVVQYEWKQRITVIRKGNPTEPRVDQVSFDSSGKMQRTTISAPPEKQMTGIRGRVAAGVKENVQQIMELVGEYNKPQQMVEAVRKSQVAPASAGSLLQLQSSGLVQPNDSMTMLVNAASHLATHLDIRTSYDGGPMTIAQDYSPVPGGPNMMKTMTVSAPQKGLVIKVDSFDFQQQRASLNR